MAAFGHNAVWDHRALPVAKGAMCGTWGEDVEGSMGEWAWVHIGL